MYLEALGPTPSNRSYLKNISSIYLQKGPLLPSNQFAARVSDVIMYFFNINWLAKHKGPL